MINLKVTHSHHAHLPCHPSRTNQSQISIKQTDRQQISDYQSENENNLQSPLLISSKKASNIETSSQISSAQINGSLQLSTIQKKKSIKSKLTPQEIYQADVISNAYKDSIKGVPDQIRELIRQRLILVEDKVYLGVADHKANLLGRIFVEADAKTHLRDQIQDNIMQMMDDIEDKLEHDILKGDRYIIHKIIRSTKQDVITNQRRKSIDAQSLTFMSGSNSQSIGSEENQVPTKQDFSLNSIDTMKAQDFIRKLQKEQVEQRKRKNEEEEKKRNLEVRSMQERREYEEEIKNQRKNYLRRRIEAKKEIKQRQMEIRQKMNKDYKDFLEKYKIRVPLFKQKQEKYQEQQQENKKKEEMILERRKQEKKSINLSEIIEHEKKYKEYKQSKSIEKVNSSKLVAEAQTPRIKYFKGRYHEILAQEQEKQKQREEKEDPKLIRSQLIKKQNEYSKSVREKYLPKSDYLKEAELQDLIKKLQWSQQMKSRKLDPIQRKLTGNEYLSQINQLMVERSKNKQYISKTIDYSLQNSRPQYKNYLSQARSAARRSTGEPQDYTKLAQQNAEDLAYRAFMLEDRARRREAYERGASLNIDRILEERKKSQHQYLESIKAKIAVLNQFQSV